MLHCLAGRTQPMQKVSIRAFTTWNTPTKPRIDERNVLFGLRMHLHALWAQRDSTFVHGSRIVGTVHLCVSMQLSEAHHFSDLLGPLLPCQLTNPSAFIFLFLSPSEWFSFRQFLTVSWWMVPRWWGDSSCSCSVCFWSFHMQEKQPISTNIFRSWILTFLSQYNTNSAVPNVTYHLPVCGRKHTAVFHMACNNGDHDNFAYRYVLVIIN